MLRLEAATTLKMHNVIIARFRPRAIDARPSLKSLYLRGKAMSDQEVLVYEEELKLLRNVAEKSSDLQKGFGWPEFRDAVGGIEKLKKEHAQVVNEYEEWMSEGDADLI